MTSLSDSLTSKVIAKAKIPFNPFRQSISATSQGDGSQPSARLFHLRALSRSSTSLIPAGGADSKTDPVAGNASTPEDSSSVPPPCTINVVLFGETGVGKSSVINLIARKDLAKVSSDVNGCTMQSTRYDISFDDMNFAIFDTIGLEEPQMGVNGYLKAIERAYELIVKLGAAGGIHLLLFCMRGGRITATTQSNYRLFCECLCNTKVPMALVFTGLEREVEMEDWWARNETHIRHYGIKSDGHACITAVQDDTPGEDLKFTESQKRIRELLKICALKNDAFLPEPHSWFARLGRGMKSFIEKHRNPKRRDVMKVLTNRCKLDPETARKIADMMEKGDTSTKEDDPTGNPQGESPPNPEVKLDGSSERDKAPKEDVPPNRPGDIRPEPRIVEESMLAKGNLAEDLTTQNQSVKSEPRAVEEGRDERAVIKRTLTKGSSRSNQRSDIKPESHVVEKERRDEDAVAKGNLTRDYTPPDKLGEVKPEPRAVEDRRDESMVARGNLAKDYALPAQLGDVKPEPRVVGKQTRDERPVITRELVKVHVPPNQPSDIRPSLRTVKKGRKDDSAATTDSADDYTPSNQSADIKLETRVVQEGRNERPVTRRDLAKDHPPPNPLGDTRPEPRTIERGGRDDSAVKDSANDYTPSNRPTARKEGRDESAVAKWSLTKDYVPSNHLGDIEPGSHLAERRKRGVSPASQKNLAKDHSPPSQPGPRAVERAERDWSAVGTSRRRLTKDRGPALADIKFELRSDEGKHGG